MSSNKAKVSFNELFLESQLPKGKENTWWRKSKVTAFIALLLFSLLAGLLVTLIVTPYTLVAAGSTQKINSWWENLPHKLSAVELPERAQLYDSKGRRIAQFYTEDRVVIPLNKMGENAPNALIATEDSRFYKHSGVDAKGIGRALANNIFGDSTQGASTLTQQLVENIRLRENKKSASYQSSKDQTPKDKIEELRYATALEKDETKDEILEAYLNIVYFGNNAYGIQAAAEKYFNVDAKDLTVPQAATLIAMLKSPTYYDPVKYPKQSRLRRDVVMKRMVEEKYLSNKDYKKFIKTRTKLSLTNQPRGCGESRYPFYCQMVLSEILNSSEFGETTEARQKFLDQGGWKIYTALDPKSMGIAQRAVDGALGRGNRVASATALIKPGTGLVLAIAQNRTWGAPAGANDFSKTQIVYATQPAFQPGSTFKAITAATALEEGYSARTKLDAPSPAYYANLDEPPGGFKNDTRHGYGYIDMYTAAKYSVNTFFTNLVSQVGVRDVAAMARRLGMTSMPEDLTGREGSITLGAYETSPLQMATVYAAFAGRGIVCDPVIITKAVSKATGDKLRVPGGNCRQEISPAIADTISDILQAPFTAGGTAQALKIGRKTAGKTGTTDDAAATWFAGYTPQLAAAVWVGDPRGGASHPLYGVSAFGSYYSTVYGGTIAGPIWKRIESEYLAGKQEKWYPKPGGVSASMTSRIVPDVKGISVDSAITLLLKAGFHVEIAQKTMKIKNVNYSDYVAQQTPHSGGKMAYGDTIKLILTEGSDTTIQIPEDYDELLLWKKADEN